VDRGAPYIVGKRVNENPLLSLLVGPGMRGVRQNQT
jgi:hypothetical protein